MITAGLTGGIATGKSTVCRMFTGLGCRIVDADTIAHQVLTWPEVRETIRTLWGERVFERTGEVSRAALGRLIFADPTARRQLNGLVHPLIRGEIDRQLREAARGERPGRPAGLTLVDVPLLIESGQPRRYGPLILVWCPRELQLERLATRDGLTPDDARRRLDAQMPIDEKRPFADHIIDTSLSMAETAGRVAEVARLLRAGPAAGA